MILVRSGWCAQLGYETEYEWTKNWNVIGPLVHHMEPPLTVEISYLSDDTPSRYRSTPRDNNLRAAGVGHNRHCWREKKGGKKKNEDLQHDNIKIVTFL